jgi:hypothetical protein
MTPRGRPDVLWTVARKIGSFRGESALGSWIHRITVYLIEAKDLDDAADVASRIPGARHGSVEVRPVMEIPGA